MLAALMRQIATALILLLFFTLLTGLLYPSFITLCAQTFFPGPANGCLLMRDDVIVGSGIIGQAFSEPKYFWGRPSATTPFPYNAQASSGSNLGPLNPDYLALVKERRATVENSIPQNHTPAPVELVTASASGLDPDISPLAAFYQIPRVAKARNLPEDVVEKLIRKQMKKRCLGILGEPRVNVLKLNLQLDELDKQNKPLPKSRKV